MKKGIFHLAIFIYGRVLGRCGLCGGDSGKRVDIYIANVECCYGVVTVKSTIGIQNAAPLLFKMRPPADVSKD